MINPIEIAQTIETKICKENLKKNYRFRKTQFYGGCATADCLGCNLRCVYCWAQKKVWYPKKYGNYYSPKNISEKLLNMNIPIVRVSGGEPTIGKEHLLELLNLIPKNILFILETNGILLDNSYIDNLSQFSNLYVRISLKGVDETTFEQITGANGKFFQYQLKALELLNKHRIKCRAAILHNLYTKEQINNLGIPDLEYEYIIKYPFVLNNLEKKGIKILKE